MLDPKENMVGLTIQDWPQRSARMASMQKRLGPIANMFVLGDQFIWPQNSLDLTSKANFDGHKDHYSLSQKPICLASKANNVRLTRFSFGSNIIGVCGQQD